MRKKTTYSELHRKVNRIAAGLKRVNIKAGDRVIVCLPDIPQAIECHYAMDKEGIYAYTFNSETKPQAVAVIAEEMNCSAAIIINEHYEEISKAIAGVNHPVQLILADINLKIPKSRVKRSVFRKVKESKYEKDEHITPWSELIKH